MSELVGKSVIVTLSDGRKIFGEIVAEGPYSISLKEGPNPGYSTKPSMIIMRDKIVTIEVK
jgi:hypothetical protein